MWQARVPKIGTLATDGLRVIICMITCHIVLNNDSIEMKYCARGKIHSDNYGKTTIRGVKKCP